LEKKKKRGKREKNQTKSMNQKPWLKGETGKKEDSVLNSWNESKSNYPAVSENSNGEQRERLLHKRSFIDKRKRRVFSGIKTLDS